MNIDFIQKIAKERYQREHDRKDQINNSLAIPITVVVALIGVAGFFLINIPLKVVFVAPPWVWYVFAVFIISLLWMSYCLIKAVCFFNKVFSGLDYGYIPTPKVVKDYTEALMEYYEKYGEMNNDEIMKVTEDEVQTLLTDRYCDSTEDNATSNNIKAFFLTKTKRSITMALVALSISVLPFIVIHYHGQVKNENIQKVEIIRSK